MSDCYDCGAPLPTREERKAGVKHVHSIPDAPPDGATYELERCSNDPMGIFGSFAVDIFDREGKTIAGMMSGRSACENLLRCRGFQGPYEWPTFAESQARRAAKRLAWKRSAKP